MGLFVPDSNWAGATATVSVATKWGRSSPVRCFARVQNQLLRHPQLQYSAQLRFVRKVNGRVNHSVNRVVHVSFTPSSRESSRACFGPLLRLLSLHVLDCPNWISLRRVQRIGWVKDSSACLPGLVGRRAAVPPARRRKPASAEPFSCRRGVK